MISLQVMYLQAFILVLLVGKLLRKIFFGQLRPAEFEVCNNGYFFIFHNINTIKFCTQLSLCVDVFSAFNREVVVCNNRDMPRLHCVQG